MTTVRRYQLIFIVLCTAALFACGEDDQSPVDSSNLIDGDAPLKVSPIERGFQIVIGPFDVPAGQETQKNFYVKFPSDQDVYVNKVEFDYNPGSHHLNIFKSDNLDVPDHIEDTFNAIQWEAWDLVTASQREKLAWTMPPGVAFHLKPHQQMDFQVHYVNATTQKTPGGQGKATITFHIIDQKNVTALVGAVFANNKKVALSPRTEATFSKVVKPFSTDVNILWMTGHFHSQGKSFKVNRWDGTQIGSEVYNSGSWDEPPVQFYDPPLTIKAGESFIYTTSYVNTSDQTIKFGPHVETEEHSNLFIFYYPAPGDGKAVYDFDGGELVESKPLK